MSGPALIEATKFFRSYGVKCEEELVEEWLNSSCGDKETQRGFCEDDLYDFNEWCRWKGTAHEVGIDEQTKVARLLEEIADLKKEITALQRDKQDLLNRTGILPF